MTAVAVNKLSALLVHPLRPGQCHEGCVPLPHASSETGRNGKAISYTVLFLFRFDCGLLANRGLLTTAKPRNRPHASRNEFTYSPRGTECDIPLVHRRSSTCCRLAKVGYIRYSTCRYHERQLIDVTVVRRVRPRAERWCDCEGHRRWKRAGRTLFCN